MPTEPLRISEPDDHPPRRHEPPRPTEPNSPDPDDARLLIDFTAGDDEALRQLARRHDQALRATARTILAGDDALADDALQAAWTRVITSARHFRGDCAVKTWLTRIVINASRDAIRRQRAHQRAIERLARRTRAHAPTPRQPNDESSPASATPDREIIARAMRTLTDEQRVAITLCFARDMTHAEAADLLGWPLGTLKTRINRALKALRAAAEDSTHDA